MRQAVRLGAHPRAGGTDFTVFSSVAERIELLLLDGIHAGAEARTVELDRIDGPLWSAFVPGTGPGQVYAYRVHGPFEPQAGHRCNPAKVLLDPYARAIARMPEWQLGDCPDPLAGGTDEPDPWDTLDVAALGTVVNDGGFDWQDVARPEVKDCDRLVYEVHVKGATQLHNDVPERLRGSYLGLCSEAMLEHFARLGVTSVQLLPVHSIVQDERLIRMGLRNYWGYNTLGWFAPEPGYATDGRGVTAVTEFRTMVRELHRAGIEVLLDVVYNHSGEGNEFGPTLSLRGFDNAAYYRLDDSGGFDDVTGTGNSLELNAPAGLQLVMDSLRYWVEQMGVDGFRFDLATTLGRTEGGFDPRAPLLEAIRQDPVLSRAVLIAEPWDLGEGGYQVGNFPWRFKEWNDRFRDTARSLWHGASTRSELATRLGGSSDLFQASLRAPCHSVNFVTAHDGFTLQDLLSFEHKHNEANGENGRDGSNHEQSRNYGVEGPTEDVHVLAQRERVRRGLLAVLFLSQGTPMLLGGDELGRSQQGNNNAYCQDNPVSWLDWNLGEREQDLLDYVRELSELRRVHPQLSRSSWLTGEPDPAGVRDVVWLDSQGRELQGEAWDAAGGQVLCGLLAGQGKSDQDLLLVVHGNESAKLHAPDGFSYLWSSAGATAIAQLPDGSFELEPVAVSLLARPAPGG